jgi:hypothetical protein
VGVAAVTPIAKAVAVAVAVAVEALRGMLVAQETPVVQAQAQQPLIV